MGTATTTLGTIAEDAASRVVEGGLLGIGSSEPDSPGAERAVEAVASSGVFSAPRPTGGGDDLTRVGRWMSPEEHLAMVDDGLVQPGRYSPHTDVASPADVEAFMRQASPGSRYVEFDVPSSALVQGGKEGWAHIPGPDSIFSRLRVRQGLPPFSYPRASNIEWLASRIG